MPISISATWVPPRIAAVRTRRRPPASFHVTVRGGRRPGGSGSSAPPASDLQDEAQKFDEHPGRGAPDGVVGQFEEPDREGRAPGIRASPGDRPPLLPEDLRIDQ